MSINIRLENRGSYLSGSVTCEYNISLSDVVRAIGEKAQEIIPNAQSVEIYGWTMRWD